MRNEIYLVDSYFQKVWQIENDTVQIYAGKGSILSDKYSGYSGEFVKASESYLSSPYSCVVDSEGSVFIRNFYNTVSEFR